MVKRRRITGKSRHDRPTAIDDPRWGSESDAPTEYEHEELDLEKDPFLGRKGFQGNRSDTCPDDGDVPFPEKCPAADSELRLGSDCDDDGDSGMALGSDDDDQESLCSGTRTLVRRV